MITKDELKLMSKEKIWNMILTTELRLRRLSQLHAEKIAFIRHYNLRLKKIRNEIDYLLDHPYSNDTGFQTKKALRDIPRNQLSKLSVDNYCSKHKA